MSTPEEPGHAHPPVAGAAGPPGATWSAPEQQPRGGDPWAGAAPPGWGPTAPAPGPTPDPRRAGPGAGAGGGPSQPPPAGGWSQLAGSRANAPYGAVILRRGIVAIKPLGLGDVLEGAFRAIRHNPRVMIGLTLLVVIATTAVSVLPVSLALAVVLPADAADTVDVDLGQLTSALVGLLAAGAFAWLGGVVATGMLTVSVGESVVDRRIGLGDVWRRVRGRIVPLAGQALLVGVVLILPAALAIALAVAVGLAAGGVAGVVTSLLLTPPAVAATVVVSVYWSLGPVALVLERASVLGALGRSYRLVRGKFWRTLGILALANVLISAIAQVITTPVGILGGFLPVLAPESNALLVGSFALSYGVSSLVGVLVYPFLAAVITLLYIDRRIRSEALDIALHRSLTEAS
ncbi:MAG: hypothetical protein ACFCUP_15855 [Actinomycetales bacterium]